MKLWKSDCRLRLPEGERVETKDRGKLNKLWWRVSGASVEAWYDSVHLKRWKHIPLK